MARRSRPNAARPIESNEQLDPRSLPVQARSRQTVNRILETAAELVDEVGVVGFTTNLVAQRAGIRIRTIYRYFPSKLGILSALMDHLNRDSSERLKRLSELGDREADWRALIGQWFDDVVQWTRERPGARLLMGWTDNIPELEAVEDRIDDEWARSLMDAMRERGVDLSDERLYAVCRTFNVTFDAISSLAGWEDWEYSNQIVEEARRMLIRYLEFYLD